MSQTVIGSGPAGARPAIASIGARLDRMPITPVHRRITAVVGVGLLFDTFDNNLSGTIAKVLQGSFALDATTLKFVLASAFIGQFLGSLVMGRLADVVGRRRAFLINLALYCGFSLLGAFSPGAWWLIATRFFAGIGIGAEQALSDCYLADVLPAARRGRFIAWAYTLSFCGVPVVGFAALWLVPHAPLGIAGWRWLFVIGSLGSAVVWALRRRLIESPRWLAARGRTAEAEALVAMMEAQVPTSSADFTPGDLTHADARTPSVVLAPDGGTGVVSGGAVWRLRDVFQPRLRRRTVMLWILCALSTVGYYGFGTLAPQILAAKGYGIVAGLGFTAVSFLGYPVGSALALPIVDRMERRALVAWSAGAMAVAGIGFGAAASPVWIVVFGIAYTLVSNIFSSACHIYLSEQYPTQIRATAAGAAFSLSKLSAGSLPFVLLPVLQSSGAGWLFVVIAAAMALLVVTVLTLGGRTTGRSVDRDLALATTP